MYSEYLKEREGKTVLESEYGFAVYQILGKECYLQDIYVKPDFRKKGFASALADRVSETAKQAGCKVLTGSVSPKANGAQASLLALLSYGMRLFKAEPDLVWFYKDL